MSIDVAIENYKRRLTEGQQRFGHGGQQRGAAGKLFEDLVDDLLFDTGRELAADKYVNSRELNGLSLGNLQVDKHIVFKHQIETLIECKAYLDACMLKRAVSDFSEICQSPDAPSVKKLAIFAGQSCISPVTQTFTLDNCQQLTGITPEIFTVNTAKQRDGNKQLHDPRFADNFQLDASELERFVAWLKQ